MASTAVAPETRAAALLRRSRYEILPVEGIEELVLAS